MATTKRNYPNDYYAWYNDDNRIAIVEKATSSDNANTHSEQWDTFQGTGDVNGTMTNMTTAGSRVTVTTEDSHNLITGDRITITGTRHYDGNYEIAKLSATTFTFDSTAVAGTADDFTSDSVQVVSGTGTGATQAAHGYSVGDEVYLDLDNNTYDGKITITVVPTVTSITWVTTLGDVSGLDGTLGDTGSFQSLFVENGLRLTYHSKYTAVSAVTDDLQSTNGLDSGLHASIVCYVKARLFEDGGDLQRAGYFRSMFNDLISKYPTRKSGVRFLSVPRI